jgi:hypothetical protein
VNDGNINNREMKKTLLALPLLFAMHTGFAEGFYFALGYDFIPGSSDVSIGYRANHIGIEAMVLNRGKEEPTTKPGPQLSLDMVAFAGSLPVFIKGGIVTGGGKNGYDVGAGADFPLSNHWAIRTQVIHFKVTEDSGQDAEAENMISVGFRYQF